MLLAQSTLSLDRLISNQYLVGMMLAKPPPLVARHPAAVATFARRSLLFGVPAANRSLLFDRQNRETARRLGLLRAYIAEHPGPITVGEVMALPGIRIAGQPNAAGRLLRLLGYSAGKGNALWSKTTREAAAPQPRCSGRVHKAVVAAMPRIVRHLAELPVNGTTSEAAVCQAAGIELRGHHRRAVGRQLRRMGWVPVRRGRPDYRRVVQP